MEESVTRRSVYDQDCQFYRYQDALMWSRFQTAATIEAGMLFGFFQMAALGFWEKQGLIIFGSLLVFLACNIGLTDRHYANGHLKRITEAEDRVASLSSIPRRKGWLSGATSMNLIIALLNLFNGTLIVAALLKAI